MDRENAKKRWLIAWHSERWSPYTCMEYIRMANSRAKVDWKPGPLEWPNYGWHLKERKLLSWATIHLWELYPEIDPTFIRSLYDRVLDPIGGGK